MTGDNPEASVYSREDAHDIITQIRNNYHNLSRAEVNNDLLTVIYMFRAIFAPFLFLFFSYSPIYRGWHLFLFKYKLKLLNTNQCVFISLFLSLYLFLPP